MKFLFMSLLYNINYVRFPGFLQKKIFFFKLYDDVRSIKMSISLYEQFFFFFAPLLFLYYSRRWIQFRFFFFLLLLIIKFLKNNLEILKHISTKQKR
jgi:hypothetical protein